jgi:3-hydroxyisobutyrate dehydrogenase
MGSAIAQRLMSVGHEVSVWNRDRAKMGPLVDGGAKLSSTPATLIDGCEAVVVMLLNDAASEAVYRGPNGILQAKLAGKLIIDMSTLRPNTMQAIGATVVQQGGAFVESPVGGSTAPAKEGKLLRLSGVRMPTLCARCPFWNSCADVLSTSVGSVPARP